MNVENSLVVAKKLGARVDPFQVIETMIEYTDQLITEVQRAKTERASIASWENVQTRKIRAQEAVLLKALDLTFDERRENFRRLFDGLDRAMDGGDLGQVAAYLESITELAKESPFKEIANLEIVVAELKRPDQVWDV